MSFDDTEEDDFDSPPSKAPVVAPTPAAAPAPAVVSSTPVVAAAAQTPVAPQEKPLEKPKSVYFPPVSTMQAGQDGQTLLWTTF